MSAPTRHSRFPVMLACIALAAGCASDPLPSATDAPALPAGLAGVHDLRGAYRAALCARDDMSDDECERVLYRFAGEVPAKRPPAADPARFRLLFVPGFLASCFPHIHSFADVVAAAEQRGFAAEVLAVGGRNNVAANARIVAAYIERLPDDGRRIIFIGHSKGAVDALEAIATSPQAAARVAAVLTVGGSLQGSAVADRLYGTYHSTLALIPFPTCDRGEGDPVEDMQPATRQRWWTKYGAQLTVPIYSIVGVPQLDRVSPLLLPSFAGLSSGSRYNDGMLLARDQVTHAGRLLGIVNADHLTVAIPYPDSVAAAFLFSAAPVPRPQIFLAAIDVIAADIQPPARR